jgi:hypothetical protein
MSAPAPAGSGSRYGAPFWVAVAVGALLVGYGALLLFGEPVQQKVSGTWRTEPVSSTARFGAILLLHDLVLIPLVVGAAAVLLRRTTPTWRAPVRFGLFLSGTVLLLAGWGAVAQIADAQPEHPTVLPNDYGVSLALLLPPIWAVALAWGLWRRARGSPDRV